MVALKTALEAAIEGAQAAGVLLRDEFYRPGGPRGPDGKAEIDVEVEDLLRLRLGEAFPTFGFRGEERPELNTKSTIDDGPTWLIDPNDGTSAFQTGYRGASVSIALVQAGKPVLGVVYAYAAPDDTGDMIAWAEGCGPLTRNGAPMENTPWATKATPQTIALVSNSADRKSAAYAEALRPMRFRPAPGIAYRLALAAVREGELALSLFHPRDFDIAAGHALIRGAGGILLDERGREICYPADRPLELGFCFAGAPKLAAEFAARDWQPLMMAKRPSREALDLCRPRIDQVVHETDLWKRARGAWLAALTTDAAASPLPGQLSVTGGAAMRYARSLLTDTVLAAPNHPIATLATAFAHGLVFARGAPELEAVNTLLSCRPIAGAPGVSRPTPRACWAVDAPILAERLLAWSPPK